jgi:hypothetical protein
LTVTIPDVNCPQCTLQLLSPMTDKISSETCTYNPLDATGNSNGQCFSNYHSCADVSIAGTGSMAGANCAALAGGAGWPFANGKKNGKTGLNFATNVYAKGEGTAADWNKEGFLVGASTPVFFRSLSLTGGAGTGGTTANGGQSVNALSNRMDVGLIVGVVVAIVGVVLLVAVFVVMRRRRGGEGDTELGKGDFSERVSRAKSRAPAMERPLSLATTYANMPTDLPEGWIAELCPETGYPYYWHEATEETRWEAPTE